MITVKLTVNPVKEAFVKQFEEEASLEQMVEALLDEWHKVHKRVDASHSPYSMAFAEMYCPEYDDEKSGELTIALDKAAGKSPVPIAPKPVPKVEKAVKPVEKPKAKAKAPVAKAAGTMSKAEQVRELIKSNPKSDADALITLAIDQLGMPKSRAKVYVKENLTKIRG